VGTLYSVVQGDNRSSENAKALRKDIRVNNMIAIELLKEDKYICLLKAMFAQTSYLQILYGL
jgi:hypothetical protein